MNSNPMGLTSGVWQGNYIQPNTATPTVSSAVASSPVGANMLNISEPVAKYTQEGTPSGNDLGAWNGQPWDLGFPSVMLPNGNPG